MRSEDTAYTPWLGVPKLVRGVRVRGGVRRTPRPSVFVGGVVTAEVIGPGGVQVVRTLRDWRGLEAVVRAAAPWALPYAADLSWLVPPPSTEAFAADGWIRPPGSARSVYRRESSTSGVLAVKGMEPTVTGFADALDDLLRPCYTPHNIAEHFVFEERKVPGCLTLAEALGEAERAAAIHTAHIAAYGTPAHVPLPLAVLRHSRDIEERVYRSLRDRLSEAALDAVAASLRGGLGVYVYHYPTVPLRVTHLDYLLRGKSFPKRTLHLSMLTDPERTIREWVTGVVRLLYLGFLPGTLAALRSGICCQPQNACLDGGFVDVDSVTPLEALPDDRAVQAALQFTTEELVRTVHTFLAGGVGPSEADAGRVRVDQHQVTQYVLALVEEAIRTEGRPGCELDPRVLEHFRPAHSLDQLVPRLATFYATASRSSAQAWRAFDDAGPAMVRETRPPAVVPSLGAIQPAGRRNGAE